MIEIFSNFDWILILKIIIGGISIGIGLFLGRYVKAMLKWIKEGIENGDGKLQNKELQIAIFTGFFGFMVFATTFFGKEYSMEMILGALAGAGIMYGANALAKK